MASARISDDNHGKANKLAKDFESEGLGILTADAIFEAGLKVKQAILDSFRNAQKKGKPAHA